MAGAKEIWQIRRIRRNMSYLLCGWSVVSVATGAALYFLSRNHDSPARKFVEALTAQFVIWGAIDLVFASIGVLQSAHADRTQPTASVIEQELNARDRLIRTLKFNSKLNWLWVACGIVLLVSAAIAAFRGIERMSINSLAGHGAGVLVQGGFLFLFDRYFLQKLARSIHAN